MKRRISIDLDDTLICYQPGVPCEANPLPRAFRWGCSEPLRLGARDLVRALQHSGWEVCIYTTSYRPCWQVRWWLCVHGIRVSRIINQRVYERTIDRSAGNSMQWHPTKNPCLFGIELHIDDSEGLRLEGVRAGFPVIVISPDDLSWKDTVLSEVSRYANGTLCGHEQQ